MEVSFGILPIIFLWTTFLFAVYLLMYYRFIYSVIDPLFLFVFTTSFASVLAIYVVPTPKDLIHFFGCQAALWIGFVIAHRHTDYSFAGISRPDQIYSFSNQSLLRWATYSFLAVFILSNFIIGYVKGFALLSDAPSTAKFSNFQEGFGLFRKMNWALSTFSIVSLVFMYFIDRRKTDIVLIAIVAFFSSLEGSKAALLQIAVSAGVVFYHPAFSDRRAILKKFQRYMPFILTGVMGVVFTVLLKENDGLEGAFLAFIRRLLYTSDSLIYFYTPINISYFNEYSVSEFFPRLVNPVLGFLRLQPYQEALGNTLYDNLRPPGLTAESITVGPNIPFYMEGRIYFYYWGAFPYSMLVGYIYGTVRVHFFSLIRTSAFSFIFTGSFCHLSQAMIIDTNLAVAQLFNLFFFIVPPFMFLSLILTGKLTLRLGRFSRYRKVIQLR